MKGLTAGVRAPNVRKMRVLRCADRTILSSETRDITFFKTLIEGKKLLSSQIHVRLRFISNEWEDYMNDDVSSPETSHTAAHN